MSKVEPHPFDEGKYQSTFDDYGHGKGNGKSRNAIYKHAKKIQNSDSETVKIETQTEDIAQNQEVSDEIPIWTNDDSTEAQEFEEWGSVEWDGEEVDVEDLLKLADFLQADSEIDILTEMFRNVLDDGNCLELFKLACTYNFHKLD